MKNTFHKIGWTVADSILSILALGSVVLSAAAFGYVQELGEVSKTPPPNIGATHESERPSMMGEGHSFEAVVTAYCPGPECTGKYSDGMTATGRDAGLPGVAIAPGGPLDYGDRVWVPGVGERVCDDTGQALVESWEEDGTLHIDVRFDSHQKAKRWGVKHLEIELIGTE